MPTVATIGKYRFFFKTIKTNDKNIKEVTLMKCPLCAVDLAMSEKQGIEIDYCPKCRGVWLDRGELDKIIEKSVQAPTPSFQEKRETDRGGHEQYSQGGYHKKHGKKSFLEELFD